MLELATVKKLLPKSHRTLITQEFLDKIEESVKDTAVAEQVKENFITYLNVLSKGRYKMEDYLSAVKYISFKLLGYSNIDAYAATFPDRYARLVREGQQKIDAFVAMYNKNKLVMQIYEQTMVPTYVLNAPLHQEALNELASMIHDPSIRGMTKVKACEAILQHTKQPEVVKGELNISIDQQDTIADLRDVTEKLAQAYRKTLETGTKTLKEISEDNIVDVSYRDLDEDE